MVILVDEYDKPLISHLVNTEKALEVRDVLRDFYSVIKSLDEYVKFIFLTGVSKFSRMSVFSGLNNLDDISEDFKYTSLLGYTQEELEHYFKDYIEDLSDHTGINREELLEKIKYWYNGYKFSENAESVYNPFSTLLLFNKKKFEFWWYKTATSKFLVDLIKKQASQFSFGNEAIFRASSTSLSVYNIEDLSPVTLLYQAGYLTIDDYNEEFDLYSLKYPNYEVHKSFTESLLAGYANAEG